LHDRCALHDQLRDFGLDLRPQFSRVHSCGLLPSSCAVPGLCKYRLDYTLR
jgi:hypothetical protein